MDNERPTPLIEDTEATRAQLETWLGNQRGHHVSIPALRIPDSSGMSNVTLLFDIQWQENGKQHQQAWPCPGNLFAFNNDTGMAYALQQGNHFRRAPNSSAAATSPLRIPFSMAE